MIDLMKYLLAEARQLCQTCCLSGLHWVVDTIPADLGSTHCGMLAAFVGSNMTTKESDKKCSVQSRVSE